MRVLGWRLGWADVLPALVLLVIGLIGTGRAAENQPETAPDLLAYALVVVVALVSVARRHTPHLVLATCAAALVTYLSLGYPFGPILFAGPVAVYGLAERLELRRAITLAAGFVLVTTAAVAPRFLMATDADALGLVAWCIVWAAVVTAPAAVGVVVRTRRDSAAAVRAEQGRRAASDERLRMARDLHDSIGHGLAVIAMQAGVALHVLDRDRERARESLEAIRSASREALYGLRAELDELRAPTGEAPARRPNPGLAELSVLVERMRAGGLSLELMVDGALGGDVPDDVAHAAYRIVQEALTNVLRHAEGARAAVLVRRQGDGLVVEVTDTGGAVSVGAVDAAVAAGPDAVAEGGSGIEGMRARAEALGGTLSTGPVPGGGYTVLATLPTSLPADTEVVAR